MIYARQLETIAIGTKNLDFRCVSFLLNVCMVDTCFSFSFFKMVCGLLEIGIKEADIRG